MMAAAGPEHFQILPFDASVPSVRIAFHSAFSAGS